MGEIAALHRRLAVDQARELGLLDPEGSGSFTHPDLSRLLYADGKVLTPLYRAKPGEMAVDRTTGEVRRLRAEPDASLHFEGDGEVAWGTKFVMVAVRTKDERGRIILDLEWVPRSGAEAESAIRCFRRITPLVPGAQGVIYDTALRGVHHQILLRELGLVPINRVAAARAGARQPRRGEGRRVDKSAFVEEKTIRLPDGTFQTLRL